MFLFKNCLQKKNDLAYTYYVNLVWVIISLQKLHLTCTDLRSSCTTCTSCKGLLTPEKYYELFLPLTDNLSWKIRHKRNILRLKTLYWRILNMVKILLGFIKRAQRHWVKLKLRRISIIKRYECKQTVTKAIQYVNQHWVRFKNWVCLREKDVYNDKWSIIYFGTMFLAARSRIF